MPIEGNAAAILPLHILGGILALAFGYFALYARKGGAAHRTSGIGFAVSMIVMSLTGAVIAVLTDTITSVAAGLMTFYMVATGWATMRRRPLPWLDRAGVLYAAIVSTFCVIAGMRGAGSGRPEAGAMFIFAIVGVLSMAGDLRMMRNGIAGPRRIARHLWRMCFAMWVAAGSFFSVSSRVPELIRIPLLQVAAVLVPLGAMVYWLVRLRGKRRTTGIVLSGASEAASS